MRKFILGYSQEKIIKAKLDIKDFILLDFIVNFIKSGRLKSRNIDGREYYLLKTGFIIECLPILRITSKEMMRRKLKKLINLNLLDYKLIKEEGNLTFYDIGEQYYDLKRLDNNGEEELDKTNDEEFIESNLNEDNMELNLEDDEGYTEEINENEKEYLYEGKEIEDIILKSIERDEMDKKQEDIQAKHMAKNSKGKFFYFKGADFNMEGIYNFKSDYIYSKVEPKDSKVKNNKEKYNKKIYKKSFWIESYFSSG